jgi:hypothetical protein
MTWQQEIDLWLQACQQAGRLHIISGTPDRAKAPSIALVCIPRFPGNPVPDDLRVKLHPHQFFECVQRFPGFPNVITMMGDGWIEWHLHLAELREDDWAVTRFRSAIRIKIHKSLSQELLFRLLMHENLYEGARCILLGLKGGGGVALFDNPNVNAAYAIQHVSSEPAFVELKRILSGLKMPLIKDPRSIVNFELLCWIIQREFGAPGP